MTALMIGEFYDKIAPLIYLTSDFALQEIILEPSKYSGISFI